MKLRVIHVYDDHRMAGWFIVQEKRWFFWEDLYHDMDNHKLCRSMVLGNADIKLAQFGALETAKKMAASFRKEHEKGRVVMATWNV